MLEAISDGLRYTNALLSGFCLALLVATLMRRWHLLTPRIRRIGIAVCALLAVLVYGSAETLATDVEPGIRIPATTLALAGLVFALLYRFDD